jgi:hypothetical protein
MRCICTLLFLLPLLVSAQDNLLDQLESLDTAQRLPVQATFKSTRVVNGHSVETMRGKHLDFRISHRFGRLNQGVYQLFGLDQATMRMGFEYGINDRLMVGVGRSTSEKVYDLYGKYRLIRQSTGVRAMPFSVTLLASAAAATVDRDAAFDDKLSYATQLLIARKFGERLSLQVSPTWIYRNRVFPGEEQGLLAIGGGGRFKLSKRISLNGEYFWASRDKNSLPIPYYDSMSWGVDIETGGHVFQLHVSNSLGMIEKQFVAETAGSWGKGDIHFGFNLSRTFSFDKSTRKRKRTEE